jgi:hypothetical protein
MSHEGCSVFFPPTVNADTQNSNMGTDALYPDSLASRFGGTDAERPEVSLSGSVVSSPPQSIPQGFVNLRAIVNENEANIFKTLTGNRTCNRYHWEVSVAKCLENAKAWQVKLTVPDDMPPATTRSTLDISFPAKLQDCLGADYKSISYETRNKFYRKYGQKSSVKARRGPPQKRTKQSE